LTALAIAAAVLVALYKFASVTTSTSGRRPPGPKGVPILGNIGHFPTKDAWEVLSSWKQYGPVIEFTFLGKRTLVLNSKKAIKYLMEKQNAITSSRPTLAMTTDWYGFNNSMIFFPYGDRLQKDRKMMLQCLGLTSHTVYLPDLRRFVLDYCLQAVRSPNEIRHLLRLLVVRNIARATYGFDVTDLSHEYVIVQDNLRHAMEDVPETGKHPVDMFPWLSHLPKRLFGANFAKAVARLRKSVDIVYNQPHERTKANMAEGVGLRHSMTETLIESNTQPNGEIKHESDIQTVAADSYAAGAETTLGTLDCFLLLMIKFPEAQRKAQQELDRVLKGERLPKLDDRASLPYIDAVLQEVLRWSALIPFSLPHLLTEDTTFEGMALKAGSTIMANSWGCLYDEEDYPDPFKFSPERFLTDDGKSLRANVTNPREFAFGYGRRICPGRHFADSIMRMTIANTLAIFDIKGGADAEAPVEFDTLLVTRFVKPFECTAEPRSSSAVDLVKSLADEVL